MFALTQNTSRQKDIAEVVLRNGWDYARGLVTNRKSDEPRLPSPAVLRNILIELGPVFVKLGQLLSTRPDLLPGRYVDALTDLQAGVPPVDWSEVESLIKQELGKPLEQVFSQIDPIAIAAGSIGQVHQAILLDDTKVALKVQRPGIDVIVAQDVAILRNLAELVSLTEFGKDFDIVALAEEFSTALIAELDFTCEAKFTEKLQHNYLKSFSLRSPRLAEVLLDRLTSETLKWNISISELDTLRLTLDDSANRLSFSILVGSLIMGAAIISSHASTNQLSILSNILFAFASLLGIWLIISILRSGRLRR